MSNDVIERNFVTMNQHLLLERKRTDDALQTIVAQDNKIQQLQQQIQLLQQQMATLLGRTYGSGPTVR